MDFQEKFIIVNGVRMHYLEKGKGEPLVFIPGLFGTATMYLAAGEMLSENFRVIIVNLPGVGKSGKLPRKWNFDDYHKSVYGLIRHLNFKQTTVVGHSFGGAVAIGLGTAHPEVISNLVLVNTLGVALEEPFQVWVKKTFRNAQQKQATKLIEFFPEFMRGLLIPHFKDVRRLIKIIFETNFDNYSLRLNVPPLILWGTDDQLFSEDYRRRLQQALKNSKIIDVVGGIHNWIIPEPERFVNYINYYVKKN